MSTEAEWCDGAFATLFNIIHELETEGQMVRATSMCSCATRVHILTHPSLQTQHVGSERRRGEKASVRVADPVNEHDIGGVMWNWCHLKELLSYVEVGCAGNLCLSGIHSSEAKLV